MIKYRVYDTQEKKYRDDLYFFIAPNGELLWSYELTDGLCPTDPQRYIIEQFTGLTDKNGREIYQGDIVSVRDNPVAIEDEKGVCFVAWSSVLAGFILKGSDAYKFDEQLLSDLKLIVIGNIHEDYDLLEEK